MHIGITILVIVLVLNMSASIRIRSAVTNDLNRIQYLIKESFLAMLPHTHESMRPQMEGNAEKAIQDELVDDKFTQIFLSKPENHFWVAVNDDDAGTYSLTITPALLLTHLFIVIGCIALKRVTCDDCELVRMAVDPTIRSNGIGSSLVKTLLEFAKKTGNIRISLVTANPLAAKFYSKNGFLTHSVKRFPLPIEGGGTVQIELYIMLFILGERILENVAVLGGTHGNERIGVELTNEWAKSGDPFKCSSFKTRIVQSNSDAIEKNVRYVDADLNRQFTAAAMDDEGVSTEKEIAVKLNKLLGLKNSINQPVGADFIIDLHSSTANTGIVLMVSGDQDVIAFRLAKHIQDMEEYRDVKITCTEGSKANSWSIDSISPYGIAVEVGPVMHGLISYPLLVRTRKLVTEMMQYLDKENQRLKATHAPVESVFGKQIVYCNSLVSTPMMPIDVYQFHSRVSFPSNTEDGKKYAVHPNVEDWKVLHHQDAAFISIDGTSELPLVIEESKFDSNTQPFYPLFINEVAYIPSNVAFNLYKKVMKYVW